MRLPRVTLLALSVAALAACDDDNTVTETNPPLAGVRYIHAVPDTGRLDFKMIDQLEYSANTVEGSGGLTFRTGSRYYATEAKQRRVVVFSFQDSSAATVQQRLTDTTITFEANKNYTLLYVGSARAGAGANRARFVVIEDAPPAVAAGNVHYRFYNATDAAVAGYVGATAAATGTPAVASVAPRTASPYTARATGALGFGVTAVGGTTALGTMLAGAGTAGTASVNPVAGSGVAGTAFSVYAFPGAVAGSGAVRGLSAANATALQAPAINVFVDRLPPNTVQ
ncbi:DUF4397 domain-containing protein [Roseisolibacter sp. H3M3-2]|uniref:DUF4397 domain-containing protein n=1 Tax=Roseisolibacter sp. H3M3-2 TaxID=3031323 RepID=UPI0023DB9F85|nr:DUF4397 domain-containing protein [Roseisolibacter sp. H3M3-2]MDF1501983.1 DUF4397 domain-containing protein [Roseisolibacter sp. H3M3-2]